MISDALRPTPDFAPASGPDSALYGRYLNYRQREASALLTLVPRDGLRPLYRAAREWAVEVGLHENKDPMATLLAYCERVLPLPPFDVWVADYQSHRLAYMEEMGKPPLAPVETEPVLVEVRGVRLDGEADWYGSLYVGHDGVDWRGHIAFHQDGVGRVHRTGEIFVEDALEIVRERFLGFTDATMAAFLRSTLP